MERPFKYWAFISYSHQDAKWAEWLHRTLERYPVPARLQGRPCPNGRIPRRLFPIFRDRDELPGSSKLGEVIQAALRESCFLIVVCSPNSVASRWVGEEIRAFKALGRENFILCLIVDGEPNATDKPECGLPECFPHALRFRLGASGEASAERTESIAADVRDRKDGRSNARLKLVAGLLDVGYDELRQRDRQRQFWQRARLTAASVALIALVAAGGHWQRQERLESQRLAAIARYTEEGRGELLAERPQRAAVYLSEAYRLGGDSVGMRFLLAQALQPPDAEPVALAGHRGEVWFATFSADSKRVVTTGWDGTARVWDAARGDALGSYDHGYVGTAARFSADGSRIASASWGGSAKVWNAAAGKPLAALDGHGDGVLAMVLDPAGTRIATGSRDGKARIWDAASGKLLFTLEGHTQPVVALAFDPGGARLVSASWDGTARVWDAAAGKLLATASGHSDRLYGAAFSPDGARFVTASRDRSARVWDASSGKPLFSLQGHTQAVLSAAYRPDGAGVVTASWDKSAKIWDARSGKLLASLDGHAQPVLSASYSRDSARIVTASWDKTAKIWDAQSGKLLASLEGHSDIVYSAEFSPDSTRLVTASFDKTAKIWDVRWETRPAEEVSAWVRCRSPWRLDAGQLVSSTSRPEDCSDANAPLPSR